MLNEEWGVRSCSVGSWELLVWIYNGRDAFVKGKDVE
jgi:hypothetical protein